MQTMRCKFPLLGELFVSRSALPRECSLLLLALIYENIHIYTYLTSIILGYILLFSIKQKWNISETVEKLHR